jgi:hypothetical protein
MAKNDVQILVLMDVYPVEQEALEKVLPGERRELKVLRLSEFGAPRLKPPPHTNVVDWHNMGEAIEKVALRVHEIQDAARPHYSVEIYVGGRAPLAAFVHLGFLFTKSVQKVVVLNPPPGAGNWEAFTIDGLASYVPNHKIYDKEIGFPKEPLLSNGRVGIVVDAALRSEDSKPFESFIEGKNASVCAILQLRRYEALTIDDVNMPAIVSQLANLMSNLSGYCPKRNGLALFPAGPTQIAFALGRAMSPNVLLGDVWLTEYRRGKDEYEYVYALPFVSRVEPVIPQAPEDKANRERVRVAFVAALDELQKHVGEQHLPKAVLNDVQRKQFIMKLRDLKIVPDSVDKQPFQLRVHEGECFLGDGILHALVSSSPEEQKHFAKLVLLHEVLHDWQSLRSTNHSLIGRAGFVLEHIDYLADVFAVQTLVQVDLDRGGANAHENVRAILRDWIDRVLQGIAAFDQAEQGDGPMVRLAERRVRRYLLWHVQWARARTIKTVKHLERLLGSNLTVELAPLAGWIDEHRWEKMVRNALKDTELCIAADGLLVRATKSQDFDPEALLEAIRTYNHERAHKEVNAVVDEQRAKLMPWTQET